MSALALVIYMNAGNSRTMPEQGRAERFGKMVVARFYPPTNSLPDVSTEDLHVFRRRGGRITLIFRKVLIISICILAFCALNDGVLAERIPFNGCHTEYECRFIVVTEYRFCN